MDNDFPRQKVQKPLVNNYLDNNYLDNNNSLDRCFISEGNVYVVLDRHHIVSGGKVWLEGEFKDVKWHRSGKGFTTTGLSPPSQSPYTDNGHDAIVALGNLEQVSSDAPGANRKCFRTNFDQNSGLGQVFNSLKCNENNAMQALYRNDTKALEKAFPEIVFSSITTANFTSTRGQSWQKGNGQEGGKDPREITPQDNPLLGTLPRKGRTGKTKQN